MSEVRLNCKSNKGIPGNIVHFMCKRLVPHGVEGLGFGGRLVQVMLVGVDGDVRVYRLVVCNVSRIYK